MCCASTSRRRPSARTPLPRSWRSAAWAAPSSSSAAEADCAARPLAPAYGASKAGLHALTGSLAQALGPHRIRVAAVAPGFVATDMAAPVLSGPRGDGIRAQSPWQRVGTPGEVAEASYFLSTEGATWSSGAVLDCNGASYLH